ncbi:GPI inositol-deacylase [Cellulomonas sp. PS-H5]|uniref:GPI inositol-deacylase n=1 Tax=Cellulomonas sp. PS-H5 TaxID=2820400 RepID=UPI001C4EE385|nr:GPI inositol-deacylase [Cellulomonas sp. PS-H5]MBW0255503.1 GPI inositol-deacylase [Cellulomonas sp. PS-H5]
MSISVSGGAGGMGARLQDLRSEAGLLDAAGDDVRRWSGSVAAVAVHPDVTVATLLCPGEVAAVAGSVAAATIGANGLLVVSTRLEGTAVVLRASATTYELVDATQQRVLEALQNAAGFTLGAALPFLAIGGGVVLLGGAGAVLARPAGWPALVILARDVDPAALGRAGMDGLYDNPWLLESLTRMAPSLVQGTTWSLGTLLGGPAGGLALPFALSGGAWPTGTYEDAVGGLVNAGGLFGVFQDVGAVGVDEVDGDWAGNEPRSVADIFREQYRLGQDEGQVQIVRVAQPGGSSAWIVQIPGTQEWGAQRGDNPVDLTTNVRLMAGQSTHMQAQVQEAMRRAGVGPGEPVMLTGHSQGGITAAALASDPAFRSEFDVRSVVTGGSPIARFDIPSSVSVLSLEHDQDAVPMLEGRENPDRANWVTVERSLPRSDFTVQDPLSDRPAQTTVQPGVGPAHGTDVYSDTGRAVDASTHPSLQRWRDLQSPFFAGQAEVTRWDVTR